MRMRRWATGLAVLGLVATGCSGEGGGEPQAADSPETGSTAEPGDTPEAANDSEATLRYGVLTAGADTLDPHLTAQSYQPQWLGGAYEPLIRQVGSGELQPLLATDWEFTDDGSVLTMNLQEGVTFHDGEPFNADAVQANIERAQTVEGSGVASALENIESVEVVDEYTVRFHMVEPSAVLPHILSDRPGMMISPAALDGDVDLGVEPVGTGPYRIVSYEPGVSAEYERFPDYWGEPGGVATIEIGLYTDANAGINALISDQIDLYEVRGAAHQQAAEDPNLEVTTFDRHAFRWLQLNHAEKFEDLRVRQALSHAVDRELLSEVTGGGAPTWQWVPPGNPAYSEELENLHPFDPERARELLQEAGYEEGEFSFEMTFSAREEEQQAGEILQQMFADVGVEAVLNPTEGATLVANCFEDHVCDAVGGSHGTQLDIAQEVSDILAPNGRRNIGGEVTMPEVWDLAQRALQPSENRQELLVELNTMMSEQIPALALYQDPLALAHRPRVQDFQVSAADNILFSSVAIGDE